MLDFVHDPQSPRTVFGFGSLARLEQETALLGAERTLVLSTPGQAAQAQRVADRLGSRAAGVFPHAAMHVPMEIVRAARAEAVRLGADCAVALGGGSTIGLGKAIALHSGLPILAVPTTYAGSEMTPIFGITDAGLKTTGRDARVLPRTVIYDPELTLGLPVPISVSSGMNAIAHAVEGLYAGHGNPIVHLMAEEGIRALARALPRLHRDGADAGARSDALYGAWLCGSVLGQADMALHHKLCHTLGGSFDLPHAETHAAVLPHALAFNLSSVPHAASRIARALGGLDPRTVAGAMFDLARASGAPNSLRDLGMREADLGRACELALTHRYPNPRPLERHAIRQLLQAAYEGRRPEATA